MEAPAVVLCSSCGGLAQRMPSLLGMGDFELLQVSDVAGFRAAVGSRSVHLILLDIDDSELPSDDLLELLSAPGSHRLVPILIVGRGDRAQNARQRLDGHFAVRVVEGGDDRKTCHEKLRRHRRVSLRVPVYAAGIAGILGQSHDLSEEGLGVVSHLTIQPGEEFLCRFSLPDGRGEFPMEAEVRRAVALSGGGTFLGLWFRQLSEESRSRLRALVDSLIDEEERGGRS